MAPLRARVRGGALRRLRALAGACQRFRKVVRSAHQLPAQPSFPRGSAGRKDADVAPTLNGWSGCRVPGVSGPRSGRAGSALVACATFVSTRFCGQEGCGCRADVERMEWMSCPNGVKAAERQSTECETLHNRWQAPVRARSLRREPAPARAPLRQPQRKHI